MIKLGLNIDHVATLRQVRGAPYPNVVRAALLAESAGVDAITLHLREDRRHIQDADIERLRAGIATVFNLEMACTDEMLAIAERLRPHQATLVPEKREEITTEGGLDLHRDEKRLADGIARLNRAGIRSSLFIDPDAAAVRQSLALGARAVELHTGMYANYPGDPVPLASLAAAADLGASLGLAVHAGHGLTVSNVGPVAALLPVEELNIGHSIVGRALFVGLVEAVREMRRAMDAARQPF